MFLTQLASLLKRKRKPTEWTVFDLANEENRLFQTAQSRYGEFFAHAVDLNYLLRTFVNKVSPKGTIFTMFLGQVREHHTLSILSAARLHRTQTGLNLRHVLEAGANAAYAIGNQNQDNFFENNQGLMNPTQELTNKRYKWLDTHYPKGSSAIRTMKKLMNQLFTHSNIVTASNKTVFDKNETRFVTSFFDRDDDYLIKGDLWTTANIIIGIMDLFNGINRDHKMFETIEGFNKRLLDLEQVNINLKQELMKNPRFIMNEQKK